MAKAFYQITPKELKEILQGIEPKKKKKLLIGIGASLVLIPLVIWPAWISRWQNQSKIHTLREQIRAAEIQIQFEPKLLEEKRDHESFIQETHSRLFSEGELQRLLGLLNELAQRSKVVILSSQPQADEFRVPEPYQKKYRAHSYSIAIEGGYHALATFASEIENYTKTLHVDQFSVTPREETPGIHLGEIQISIFLRKD